MFTDNEEAEEDEIDQEVAQTYDARNKTAKTVSFSQQSSPYSQSLGKSHRVEGMFN